MMNSPPARPDAINRQAQAGVEGAGFIRHPLGPLEEIFWNIGNRFEGDGAAAISASLGGVVQPELLAGALALVQKRHPRLRARIVTGPDGRPIYEVLATMAPIPVRFVKLDAEELPWATHAQRAVETDFQEGGPLCHVTVLESTVRPISEIVMTFHHSLTDGTAGLMLFHEVLSKYEALHQGHSLDALLAATEPLPFVSAGIPPVTASWGDRWAMFSRLVRGFVRKRRAGWTPLPRDSAEYTPRWFRRILSAEETRALERRCRQQRLPVYGAVFALAVTSLRDVLSGEPARLVCRCPVNMRELPNCSRVISFEDLGCFVSGLDRLYVVHKSDDFWRLARLGCEDVRGFITRQGPAMALRLLPVADRITRFLRISPRRPPMRDTMSVNYIPCPPVIQRQYGDLTLEAVSGLNRCRFMGVSLMVAATSLKGRLNFTLGSVDVSEQLHVDFYHALSANIDRLARGEL